MERGLLESTSDGQQGWARQRCHVPPLAHVAGQGAHQLRDWAVTAPLPLPIPIPLAPLILHGISASWSSPAATPCACSRPRGGACRAPHHTQPRVRHCVHLPVPTRQQWCMRGMVMGSTSAGSALTGRKELQEGRRREMHVWGRQKRSSRARALGAGVASSGANSRVRSCPHMHTP